MCAYSMDASTRRHDRALRAKFGITEEHYQDLLAAQNFCCGICGRHYTEFTKRLAVDHDHRNGPIRGLLCEDCNYKVGMIHDDESWVCGVCEYLRGKFAEAVARIVGPDHRVTGRPRQRFGGHP